MADITAQGTGLVKPTGPQYNAGSPEGIINQQAGLMRKQLQEKFQTEWGSLNKRVKAAGIKGPRHQQIMNKLHDQYKVKAVELDQKIRQKSLGFEQVDELGKMGKLPNASEIKWRMALPDEAEADMFPRQKEPDVNTQRLQAVNEMEKSGEMPPDKAAEIRRRMALGPVGASVFYREKDDPDDPTAKLRTRRNEIDTRLKDFRIKPGAERKPWYSPGPAKQVKPDEIQIFDTSRYSTDKDGKIVTGAWRKASPAEGEERLFWLNQKARNWAEQRMASGGAVSNILQTATRSPRMMGGPIPDQINQYIERRAEAGPGKGDGYTKGQAINRGGKSYKIVGFDTDGEPLVEEVR